MAWLFDLFSGLLCMGGNLPAFAACLCCWFACVMHPSILPYSICEQDIISRNMIPHYRVLTIHFSRSIPL